MDTPPRNLDRAREEWERQPGETDRAFARFLEYLSRPPPRKWKETAVGMGMKYNSLISIGRRNRWAQRARAYDDRMASRAAEAAMSHAEDMQTKHLSLLQEMLARGLELIREGDGDARAGAKMVTEGVRLERLIIGEATDRTESQVSTIDRDPDLSRLTDEEREEWLAGLEDDTVVRWLELDDKARGRESAR